MRARATGADLREVGSREAGVLRLADRCRWLI